MGIAVNPTLFTPDYGSKPVTLLKGPVVSAISLVNKGANKKRFFLFKSEDSPIDNHGFYLDEQGNFSDPDDFNKVLPLIKAGPANDAWSTVYCVVAVPGEVDAQKDVWDEATIRDSAHDYLKKSRLINYMHKDLDAVGNLVESAIAPADMKVGEDFIAKGSWFIAIEPNPDMKKMIESGDVTGVSVQGSSKREELSTDNPMMLSMAKGSYESAVVPRTVTQTDYAIPENKEDMEVPDNTEGPGITMLQHILGVPETGKFDVLTKKATQEWMATKGVPGKPTLATIKHILTEEPKAVEQKAATAQPAPQDQAPTSEQPGQVQEAQAGPDAGQSGSEEVIKLLKSKGPIYHYHGDSSKTPLWVKELGTKDVTIEFPQGKDAETEAEVAKVELAELYKCDNPDAHYEKLAKDHPSPAPPPPYNPATMQTIPSNTGSGGMDSTSYGTHAENEGNQPQDMKPDSSDDELKAAIVRALTNGNEILLRHLSDAYGISSGEQLMNYPFTQDELWGLVSRYILGRMDNPPSESMMMQPVRRMDRSVYPEGAGFSVQKVAPFDYHTPDVIIPDKLGQEISVGAVVKLSDGDVAVVSSIDLASQELHVEVLPMDGTGKVRIVKAKSVTVTDHDTAPQFMNSIDTTTSKDFAKDISNFGEVLLKGVWAGSMGGHDPEAQGKIKYIVRSFGKWAHGKEHIAARKLLEHGVVKTPEAANRLASWLKDQWMHSTKWRTGNKGGRGIHKSAFATAYDNLSKDAPVDPNMDPNVDPNAMDNAGIPPELSGEELHTVFVIVCEICGHDPAEMQHMMMEDHHNFNDVMDQEFGAQPQDQTQQDLSGNDLAVAKSFVSIMRGEDDLIEKLLNVEELLNKNQPNMRKSNNKDFMVAMTALQIGLADAIGNNDLEKREVDLDSVLVDFGGWLQKFVEAGNYFDYELEKVEKVGSSLSKGWMPTGMTQGELDDGDFAWVAKNKDLPDSKRRKMPYKIHGTVNEAGWKAAWGVANGGMGGMITAGGPSIKAVKAKLLKDKPKDINVNPDLQKDVNAIVPEGLNKMDNLKGATVQSSDGKKWIVIGQDGDSLSLRSGQDSATMSVGDVEVVKQPMGKAMPPALAEGLKRKRLGGAPAAPEAVDAPVDAPVADHTHPTDTGSHTGPPVVEEAPAEGRDGGHDGAPAADAGQPEAPAAEGAGSRLAQLLAAARKKKAAMAAGASEDAPVMKMEKSAEPLTAAKLDRLRETRSFLESVLNYEAEEAAPVEEPAVAEPVAEVSAPEDAALAVEPAVADENDTDNTEVEKDVEASQEVMEDNNMDDSDVTMGQIIEAINGLGEEVDGILAQVEEFGTLGSKLDHIGDLAKSLDSTERIDVLEQAVERLTEALGVFTDTAESVETLTKRLTALEIQPGSSTAAPVDASDHQVIEKSAPVEEPLFQRTWGSIF